MFSFSPSLVRQFARTHERTRVQTHTSGDSQSVSQFYSIRRHVRRQIPKPVMLSAPEERRAPEESQLKTAQFSRIPTYFYPIQA